jgi:hypothetical protein
VIYVYCGSVFMGYATWMPKNDYTDGEWECTRAKNRNPHTGGVVLYWCDFPPWPKDVLL